MTLGRAMVFAFGVCVGVAVACGAVRGFVYARHLGQQDVWQQAARLHLAIETDEGFEFNPPRPWAPRPMCKCSTCTCSPCLCPVLPGGDEPLVPARVAPAESKLEP